MSADRCRTCGDLNGHTNAVAAAECALLVAHWDDLAGLVAPDDRALRVQLWDLYAHLRGVFPASQAHAAARYVVQLGWRPWARSDTATHPEEQEHA